MNNTISLVHTLAKSNNYITEFLSSYYRIPFHSISQRMKYQDILNDRPELRQSCVVLLQNNMGKHLKYGLYTMADLLGYCLVKKQKYTNAISIRGGYSVVDVLQLRQLDYEMDSKVLVKE